MKSYVGLCIIIVILGACESPSCPDGAAPLQVSLTKSTIETLAIEAMTQLVIDNYQPTRSMTDPVYAFRRLDASSVSVGSGTLTSEFDIPPSRHDPYTIYIDDLTSSRITLTTEHNDLVLHIIFNSAMFYMNCVADGGVNLLCLAPDPNFTLENFSATISFVPFATPDGKFTYLAARAEVSFDRGAGYCKDNFWAFLCASDSSLKTSLEHAIETELMRDDIRIAISNQLDCAIRAISGNNKPFKYITIDANGTLFASYCKQSEDVAVACAL